MIQPMLSGGPLCEDQPHCFHSEVSVLVSQWQDFKIEHRRCCRCPATKEFRWERVPPPGHGPFAPLMEWVWVERGLDWNPRP